jgi:membrane protease subunit HflK
MSGGGGGGPWGQSPPGGRRGGPQPPDLEELLRRGQDKMKNVLPSGGVGGFGILVGIAILLFLWGVSGFYTVEAEEQGVVLRFGKLNRITAPGLNYHLPFPIETVYTPKVTTINQINIGVNPGDRDIPFESLMLTGDENIVNIHFSVFWLVRPPEDLDGTITPGGAADYLFNVQNPDQTVKAVAESAMREVVGRNDLEPIITEGRQIVEQETQQIIQSTLDSYGTGILITQVQLQKADPPDQVIDAFRDVVAAEQDQERLFQEARAYANKIVPEARGEAQQVIQQAEGYRAQTVVEANGEATRFNSIYQEYRLAKSITRERMFLETMERVFRDKNKIVIDEGAGTGVVPYLPLPALQRSTEEGDSQ